MNPYVQRTEQLVDFHSRVAESYCKEMGKYSIQRWMSFSNKVQAHIAKLGEKALEWESNQPVEEYQLLREGPNGLIEIGRFSSWDSLRSFVMRCRKRYERLGYHLFAVRFIDGEAVSGGNYNYRGENDEV